MSAPARPAETATGLDLWAPVGTDGMPAELLEAFAVSDWPAVKALVTKAAPRGIFGRQASQFRSRLPLGIDPALTQALGGPLPVAIALAQEAQRLGDEGDVFRVIGHDLAALSRFAAGEDWKEPLAYPTRLATQRGSPPVEACGVLLSLCPLLEIRHDGLLPLAAAL